MVYWQVLTSGVSLWKRHSLLLKLSGQTQLLEELAEISVDRLGTITSAADGRYRSVCLTGNVYFVFCRTWKLFSIHLLRLVFPLSSAGPRRAPRADGPVVGVQWVCRTFSHHTGQSVQTHEPVLHCSAAGDTSTQR